MKIFLRKPDDLYNNIEDPQVREFYLICKKKKMSIDERCLAWTRATYYRWVKNKLKPNEAYRKILQEFIDANS